MQKYTQDSGRGKKADGLYLYNSFFEVKRDQWVTYYTTTACTILPVIFSV